MVLKQELIKTAPAIFFLTVHTAFGLPGNSDTAISVT